jgi:hypothetical protein
VPYLYAYEYHLTIALYTEMQQEVILNNPLDAANILKVYYSDLSDSLRKEAEELRQRLEEVESKLSVAESLRSQAEGLVQGTLQLGLTSATPAAPPSSNGHYQQQAIPLDVPTEEEPNTEGESDEDIVLDFEGEETPLATVRMSDDGNVEIDFLPRFSGMKKVDAISLILKENDDRLMHRSSIMTELYGRIDDDRVRALALSRIGGSLTSGKEQGKWFADPSSQGFYTANRDLIKKTRR